MQAQLAALVSKCKGVEDLEYFLQEAASLVGLNAPPETGAKVRPTTSQSGQPSTVVAVQFGTSVLAVVANPAVFCALGSASRSFER